MRFKTFGTNCSQQNHYAEQPSKVRKDTAALKKTTTTKKPHNINPVFRLFFCHHLSNNNAMMKQVWPEIMLIKTKYLVKLTALKNPPKI